MVTATAANIPTHITQAAVAGFLAEHLELRDGLYLWKRGFDPLEVKNSVEKRWGRNSWERIRRQALRTASANDPIRD